jgi:hypothetical protein
MDRRVDGSESRLEQQCVDLAVQDALPEEQGDRRALYSLAYSLLPLATQQRLQFVRWLVESGRLEP